MCVSGASSFFRQGCHRYNTANVAIKVKKEIVGLFVGADVWCGAHRTTSNLWLVKQRFDLRAQVYGKNLLGRLWTRRRRRTELWPHILESVECIELLRLCLRLQNVLLELIALRQCIPVRTFVYLPMSCTCHRMCSLPWFWIYINQNCLFDPLTPKSNFSYSKIFEVFPEIFFRKLKFYN